MDRRSHDSCTSITRNLSKPREHSLASTHGRQTYPIDFNSQTYNTLLDGTFIKFDAAKGNPNAPEWSNVLVNSNIRIVGSKEVRIPFRYHPTSC